MEFLVLGVIDWRQRSDDRLLHTVCKLFSLEFRYLQFIGNSFSLPVSPQPHHAQ